MPYTPRGPNGYKLSCGKLAGCGRFDIEPPNLLPVRHRRTSMGEGAFGTVFCAFPVGLGFFALCVQQIQTPGESVTRV